MTNPHNILAIFIVGASILAFQNRELMTKLVLSPYLVIKQNQWYRTVTHAFIHADWVHLLFNVVALWSFGSFVYNVLCGETQFPVAHFFAMYFGAILCSSVNDIIKHRNNPNYASLGASGGVSAIIFCAILFNPWSLILVFFIPCPGIVFGVLYLIYSNYMSRKSNDLINHGAHFYGAVFGLVYPIIINPEIYSIFVEQLQHPHF